MLPMIYMALIEDENDQALYKALYDKYERLLLNIAFGILDDRALAEDAVSETFFKVSKCFQRIHNFELSKIAGYAVIIIRNTCNDMLEAEQKQQAAIDSIAEELHEEDITDIQDSKAVAFAVNKLPDMYRDVLLMKYYYGLTIQEIANQLGLSYNGVRYRIDASLKLLRKELQDD